MRQPVDQQRIELFLQRLGRQFTKPGRVYLVGGTTMVYEGLRQQTLDIDIAYDIANEDHSAFIAVVRELKERLSLNIEEASPADFIPVPAGSKERSEYIGRYGQLEAFHYDFYSLALSKIERGTENDFADVIALLKAEKIEWEKLVQYFDEIMVRYATDSLKQAPDEFQDKFAIVGEMWREESARG